ncbi:hypothetical protein AB1Y20_002400 [Prymnesium parvum]|uniref:Carrier domain-containing protein n=1 Tax=Prymnesium parvum TaxID=97485 RepID=A0AB34JB82_PRYPA
MEPRDHRSIRMKPRGQPSCRCASCGAHIAEAQPRSRCLHASCDELQLCSGCASATAVCPACLRPGSLYSDRASGLVLRQSVFREAFSAEASRDEVVHPRDMLQRAFDAYAARPLLGEPQTSGEVEWWSYAHCAAAARRLALALEERREGCDAAAIICAHNCAGWLVADWACVLARWASIVCDPSYAAAAALAIARQVAGVRARRIGAVFVDVEQVETWARLLRDEGEGGVLISSTADGRERLRRAKADVTDCTDASWGAEGGGASAPGADRADLITCLFSFGSTGEPKPLWFDARQWAEWGERNPPVSRRARAALARRSVRVSCAALFAPLSHGLARRTAWGELIHGGRLGLCHLRGARDGILEQIRAVAPTSLSAAPRFYSLYQQRFELQLNTATSRAEALANVCLLGGPRLRLVAIGGAVVPQQLLDFLHECFGEGGAGGGRAIVSNGYGMAEVPGGIARDGVPLPGVEVRLKPLSGEDQVEGLGPGMGEILVKTTRGQIVGGCGGALLDAEGWFHTGDLGKWEESGGARRLRVIDRISFTVKLSNGKFFAPQNAEAVYVEHCPSVSACVLYARSGDVGVTAMVLLQDTATSKSVDAAAVVLNEMRAAAMATGLHNWEVPLRVVIDCGPWDEKNGCCSVHGKLRRFVIARRNGVVGVSGDQREAHGGHSTQSESMDADGGGVAALVPGDVRVNVQCKSGSIPENEHLESFKPVGGAEELVHQICAFLSSKTDAEASMKLPSGAWVGSQQDWLATLGGDSVAALKLVAHWEKHLDNEKKRNVGVQGDYTPCKITVRDVFALTPWQLRRKALGVEEEVSQHIESFNAVGNASMQHSHTSWEQEALTLDAACVEVSESKSRGHDDECAKGSADSSIQSAHCPCVVLTGATGFLGSHVLATLLSNTSPCRWGRIVVLVRKPIERVLRLHALSPGDGARIDERVLILAADTSLPDLGLSPEDRLALTSMRIDAVIHAAAAIDHTRPYDRLRPTNVGAVDALLHLLAQQQRKSREDTCTPSFVFVSTMSVIPKAEPALAAQWEAPQSLVPPRCAAALESGYAQTKLIAEHHLALAADTANVRPVIVRLGLLGSPSKMQSCAMHGDVSLPHRRDWLSLLLCAVQVTGAKPSGLTSGNRTVAVLPVDLAATALAEEAARGVRGAAEVYMREEAQLRFLHLDAAAFGIAPQSLSTLLEEIEASRGKEARPLSELPYPAWRRLVAAAGPPASLALVMLPEEARGGALRLPSGARRRLRDIEQRSANRPQFSSSSAQNN